MKKPLNRLLITPSLINAWKYIEAAGENLKDSDDNPLSLEDRQDEARKKAYQDFLLTLDRVKIPTTEAQQRGIDYERDTYAGLTEASPYVKGGQFQSVGMKEETIDGQPYLLYGRLDCLKAGVIYDIKRVGRYTAQKYLRSAQHGFYLALFPEAYKFTYLVFDGNKLHTETYYRDEARPVEQDIKAFADWLRQEGLFERYELNWRSKSK